MVDFYGFHVGKYTVRPMDPMGKNILVLVVMKKTCKHIMLCHLCIFTICVL